MFHLAIFYAKTWSYNARTESAAFLHNPFHVLFIRTKRALEQAGQRDLQTCAFYGHCVRNAYGDYF